MYFNIWQTLKKYESRNNKNSPIEKNQMELEEIVLHNTNEYC